MSILLVDDDEDLLDITCRRLQKKGFTVLVAHNLAQAKSLLEEHDSSISAIVCDLFLGIENGINFFDSIEPLLRGRIFVVATGDESGDDRIPTYCATKIGFSVLSKPYPLEKLVTKIQEQQGAA